MRAAPPSLPAAPGLDLVMSDLSEPELIRPGGGNLPGGYLAFYTAQSTEFAREVNMAPEGEPAEVGRRRRPGARACDPCADRGGGRGQL